MGKFLTLILLINEEENDQPNFKTLKGLISWNKNRNFKIKNQTWLKMINFQIIIRNILTMQIMIL